MNRPDLEESFSRSAAQPTPGIVAELLAFLAHRKKWWLTPVIVGLLLVGLLVAFGGTAAAPFIYTLF